MADPQVLNTNADLDGNTLLTAENDYTISGLHTFDRNAAVPFAVDAASLKVTNLDADKVDGKEAAAFPELAAANIFTGVQTIPAVATASGTTASTATGTPVTLFSALARGRYEIFLGVQDGVGFPNSYASFATVVSDGVAARIVSNNATNSTITLSGTNVQAMQNSGNSITMYWMYQKIATEV